MTNSVIQKIVLFVFFGIVASGCALESDSSVTAKKDIEKPTLTEITAVSTPTSDSTPNYTFNSTEAGTITYGGSCSSSTTLLQPLTIIPSPSVLWTTELIRIVQLKLPILQ